MLGIRVQWVIPVIASILILGAIAPFAQLDLIPVASAHHKPGHAGGSPGGGDPVVEETVIYVYGTSGDDDIVVNENSSCEVNSEPGKATVNGVEVSCGTADEYIIYAGKGSDTIMIIDGDGDHEYYVYDGPGGGLDSNTIYDGSGNDEYFIYMAGGNDSADIFDGLGNDVYFIYMAGGNDSANIFDNSGIDSYNVYGGGGIDVLTVKEDTCSTDHYVFYGGAKDDTFSIDIDCLLVDQVFPGEDSFIIYAESSPTN